MAWSLSQSRGGLHNVHYADSIGHVKKCLFGNFGSNVQGGSVGRVSVFAVGSNLALVTFFSLSDNSLDSFKLWVQSRPGHFFLCFFLLSDNSF